MFDISDIKLKMSAVLEKFQSELKKVRTGRAHPDMLKDVRVEVYGTFAPLNQAANVTVADATMLVVTPYDPKSIPSISSAIRSDQALGLNPSDDGRVVRVPIPPLTEERRAQIVKQTGEKVENAKIELRAVRQDALKEVKKLKEDGQLSEDMQKRMEKEVEDATKDYSGQIDTAFKDKEAEIMKV